MKLCAFNKPIQTRRFTINLLAVIKYINEVYNSKSFLNRYFYAVETQFSMGITAEKISIMAKHIHVVELFRIEAAKLYVNLFTA